MKSKVDIFVKELELTDELKKYVIKKTERLDRYLDQIDETRIDLNYNKTARETENRFVAQITLRGRGFILRAEERAIDIRTAFDKVMDKIERQIERYKGKRIRGRAGAPETSDILKEEVLEESKPLIARRKKFSLVPMDELEAIEQMNLLGHEDFFIFYNIGNNAVNVLYKRRDGTYGIIEPELG
jgi:putative sigma-54 modulation protein